jgi:two-component system cell cycle response regulator DivK
MARILVIEDTPANRKLVHALLEQAGHAVESAEDAETGLALAFGGGIDLVLMDIHLPGMDGLAATRMLKEDADTRGIPVLAVTALAMESDKARILAAGCDGYIAKPVRCQDLLTAVSAALPGMPKPPEEDA